jgi:hypothetical protein
MPNKGKGAKMPILNLSDQESYDLFELLELVD